MNGFIYSDYYNIKFHIESSHNQLYFNKFAKYLYIYNTVDILNPMWTHTYTLYTTCSIQSDSIQKWIKIKPRSTYIQFHTQTLNEARYLDERSVKIQNTPTQHRTLNTGTAYLNPPIPPSYVYTCTQEPLEILMKVYN